MATIVHVLLKNFIFYPLSFIFCSINVIFYLLGEEEKQKVRVRRGKVNQVRLGLKIISFNIKRRGVVLWEFLYSARQTNGGQRRRFSGV